MSRDCTHCDEPVLAGEQHPAFQAPMHQECGFRSVVGSVAHVLRRCDCFMLGSKLSDPPGLTKREAARAAHDLFRQILGWYGEGAA